MSNLDLDEQADEWARKHPELERVCNMGQDHIEDFPINSDSADSPEQDWLNCTPYVANPYFGKVSFDSEWAENRAKENSHLKKVCLVCGGFVSDTICSQVDNPYYTPEGGNKMKVDGLTRNHQTLAVYDFTNSTTNYANGSGSRSARLSQSLNGDNIKADEVSINGGNAVKGYSPSVASGPGKIRVKDIEAFAAEKGYNHVVISRPVG